jgi:hypothetical protein
LEEKYEQGKRNKGENVREKIRRGKKEERRKKKERKGERKRVGNKW